MVGKGKGMASISGIRWMKSVGLLALSFWLLVGCAGQQQEQAQSTTPVTGEFVGEASAQDAFVALFSEEGSSADESKVVAYVCNRQVGLTEPFELAEWFEGTA